MASLSSGRFPTFACPFYTRDALASVRRGMRPDSNPHRLTSRTQPCPVDAESPETTLAEGVRADRFRLVLFRNLSLHLREAVHTALGVIRKNRRPQRRLRLVPSVIDRGELTRLGLGPSALSLSPHTMIPAPGPSYFSVNYSVGRSDPRVCVGLCRGRSG